MRTKRAGSVCSRRNKQQPLRRNILPYITSIFSNDARPLFKLSLLIEIDEEKRADGIDIASTAVSQIGENQAFSRCPTSTTVSCHHLASFCILRPMIFRSCDGGFGKKDPWKAGRGEQMTTFHGVFEVEECAGDEVGDIIDDIGRRWNAGRVVETRLGDDGYILVRHCVTMRGGSMQIMRERSGGLKRHEAVGEHVRDSGAEELGNGWAWKTFRLAWHRNDSSCCDSESFGCFQHLANSSPAF